MRKSNEKAKGKKEQKKQKMRRRRGEEEDSVRIVSSQQGKIKICETYSNIEKRKGV